MVAGCDGEPDLGLGIGWALRCDWPRGDKNRQVVRAMCLLAESAGAMALALPWAPERG